MSRTHRERLSQAGYLQEVINGWYLPAQPDVASRSLEGSTAAWFAGMRDFVPGYCDNRFGAGWHLGPDQSLLLRSGERTLSRQLQVWATASTACGAPLTPSTRRHRSKCRLRRCLPAGPSRPTCSACA